MGAFAHKPQHAQLQLSIAKEFEMQLHERVIGQVYLQSGQRVQAEAAWQAFSEWAGRTVDARLIVSSLTPQTWLATIDGDLERALELGTRIISQAAELGSPQAAQHLVGQSSSRRALLYLGRGDEALAAVHELVTLAGVGEEGVNLYAAPHILCLVHAGQRAQASAALWRFIRGSGVGTEADETPMPNMHNLLETAVLLADREAAAVIMPTLEGFAHLIDVWYLTCIARHLGAAAALLGDKPKAMAYNRQTLEVAGKVRFRPEIALTRLQMAELLLDDADAAKREDAHAHLDFAIDEFRAMKMQPALERALRDKSRLEA